MALWLTLLLDLLTLPPARPDRLDTAPERLPKGITPKSIKALARRPAG